MVMIPRCYTVIAGEPDVGTSFVRAYNNIIARSHNFIVITSLYFNNIIYWAFRAFFTNAQTLY